MRRPKYTIFMSLFLGSLAGCNFAPKYTPPDQPIPNEWRTESEIGKDSENSGWWKLLGDEVLDSLIQVALQNNRDLQVAVWRVKQYQADYYVAHSSLFPQVSLNSLAVKEKLPIDEDFLPPGFNSITPDYRLNVSLSYELDFWGKIRNSSFAAYSQYLAEVANRRTVVLTLVSSVVQAYVYLRQLDLQLQVSRKILETRKESLEIARYRFEGGLTSKIEVDQALSVYEESIAAVEDFKRKVPQQENLLSVLLGEAPHLVTRGKTLREFLLPEAVPVGMPVDLLTRRPDIIQAENNLIAANANIGVARASFFPQINFATLYGLDSLQLKTLFQKTSKTWTIGGTFLQELFTGGALTAQLKIAEAQKKELVATYEQKILKALQEVNDSLIGFKQSKKIFVANEAEVAALKDYLELAWYRYYEGETQYLTVLDAERKVFSAELNMISSEADQFLTLVNIYKSVGGGWVLEADKEVPIK